MIIMKQNNYYNRKEVRKLIVLYTIGCPQCLVLEKKLDMKNIKYDKVTDESVMVEKGFMSAPVLEVDGIEMNFKEANEWLKNN